jgi:hypothetical protein
MDAKRGPNARPPLFVRTLSSLLPFLFDADAGPSELGDLFEIVLHEEAESADLDEMGLTLHRGMAAAAWRVKPPVSFGTSSLQASGSSSAV